MMDFLKKSESQELDQMRTLKRGKRAGEENEDGAQRIRDMWYCTIQRITNKSDNRQDQDLEKQRRHKTRCL